MIEEALVNYGALGIWTLCNLYLIRYFITKNETQEASLSEIINNNTIAMTKVYEIMNNCKKKTI